MKLIFRLLFGASLLAGLTSCAFDTVSLSVGYGKANVAGTVHLREPTSK